MSSKNKSWMNRFRYAYEGLLYAISTQSNMKVHVFIALMILGAALFFQCSPLEYLLLIFSVTLVMAAECMNTAVEKAVDLAMPNIHPWAKIAKDTAAASVLLTAVFAVASGVYVFGERLLNLVLRADLPQASPFHMITAVTILYFVFIAVLIAQAFTANKPYLITPSLWFSLLSAVLSITVYMIMEWEYFIAVAVLYFIVCGIRIITQKIIILSILYGSVMGVCISVLLLWMHTLG
jgi:diacylglycerol kinase